MMLSAFDSRLGWLVEAAVEQWSNAGDGGTLDIYCL